MAARRVPDGGDRPRCQSKDRREDEEVQPMILLLDNYDSFVYNLARYFDELGCGTRVVRNSAVGIEEIRALRPQALVISPGPYDPPKAGISLEAVQQLAGEIPILGICLGHQVIAAAFGAQVVRGTPVHGQAEAVYHDGRGIFRNIPSPFQAGRYHSLVVSPQDWPETLEVAAWTRQGTVMALRHRELPVTGAQFHPESVLTEYGHTLIRNFLES
jgi:anthranilate synthase/aminodeoxychorismate synthase-like glutamine amidotransferase